MSLIVRELQKVWEAMRASMPQRRGMLQEVHIRNFWSIRNLRVPFGYPVSVLAGPNGCGKIHGAVRLCLRVPGTGQGIAGVCPQQPVSQFHRPARRLALRYHSVQPLFLLGNEPPEGWIWQTLRRRRDVCAPLLGLSLQDMDWRMRDIDQMTAGMVRQGDYSKAALEAFAAELSQTGPGIARIAGRRETQDSQPELAEFLVPLGERINAWRQF